MNRRRRPVPRLSSSGLDTVIVEMTAGGETITSRPMPRLQAELLLVLGVRGGHGLVRRTGIVGAVMRRRTSPS